MLCHFWIVPIVNYLGNEVWTKNLQWDHKAEFNDADLHDWNSGAGMARSSSGLIVLHVVDGGHMVPSWKFSRSTYREKRFRNKTKVHPQCLLGT